MYRTAATPQVKPLIRATAPQTTQPYPPSGGSSGGGDSDGEGSSSWDSVIEGAGANSNSVAWTLSASLVPLWCFFWDTDGRFIPADADTAKVCDSRVDSGVG